MTVGKEERKKCTEKYVTETWEILSKELVNKSRL